MIIWIRVEIARSVRLKLEFNQQSLLLLKLSSIDWHWNFMMSIILVFQYSFFVCFFLFIATIHHTHYDANQCKYLFFFSTLHTQSKCYDQPIMNHAMYFHTEKCVWKLQPSTFYPFVLDSYEQLFNGKFQPTRRQHENMLRRCRRTGMSLSSHDGDLYVRVDGSCRMAFLWFLFFPADFLTF